MIKIERFSIENSINKIVTDEEHPSFSFNLSSDKNNVELKRCVLKVNNWFIEFKDKRLITYDGEPLIPFTTYDVELIVETTDGDVDRVTRTFETGFLKTKRKANWITDPKYKFKEKKVSPKPLLFKKRINFSNQVKSIKLYATAIGIYDIKVNNKRISDRYFAPGFTSYKTNLQYQTYDLLGKIKSGDNLIITVAGGWAVGSFVMNRVNRIHGDKQALKAELHITYINGEKEIITTDESWLSSFDGPYLMADFYDGETFDARISEDSIMMRKAQIIIPKISPKLISDYSEPVREHEVLIPELINKIEDKKIYDFKQNYAGIVTLTMKNLKPGQKIIIRHAEVLKANGDLNVQLLRSAKATITYIAHGDKTEFYKPTFTYMGFRYISIEGIEPENVEVKGVALYSDIETIGNFKCSNELLNRLQKNIVRSSKSNFVDIPTDCPQRDERMGWTGDINVFTPTACFNFDMTRFLKKWLKDLKAEQIKTGGIPNCVPINGYGFPITMPKMAIDWWGDACVNIPYYLYKVTTDEKILEEMYPVMKKYTDAEKFWAGLFGFGDHKYIFKTLNVFHFGDWIAPDVNKMSVWQARHKWTATASLKICSETVSKVAQILNKFEDEKYYRIMSKKTSAAYINVLTDKKGKLLNEFQTGYVLPIYFDIFEGEEKLNAAKNLAKLVEQNNYGIYTGFPGTPYILFALNDNAQKEVAFKMLMNTNCPSWLYEVKVGGTSIWERWDGMNENGLANCPEDGTGGMISFNHYASGAVGDFLYRRIAGIEMIDIGYKKFKIEPVIGGNLTSCDAYTHTYFGKVHSKWEIKNGEFTIEVEVPIGSKCELIMPSKKHYLLNNGKYNFNEKMEK